MHVKCDETHEYCCWYESFTTILKQSVAKKRWIIEKNDVNVQLRKAGTWIFVCV